MTGCGFYTEFHVAESAPRILDVRSLWFGSAHAQIPGLKDGAGFVLHIGDGAIDQLEGFSYDDEYWPDPWPGVYDELEIYGVSASPSPTAPKSP